MVNRLVNSNRKKIKDQLKPKNIAKATDFTNTNNETVKDNESDDKKRVTSVTFATNLKINNHTRNRLQAMSILGYASSQKNAVDIALSAYFESLTSKEREEIKLQIQSLEHRDTLQKKK